MNSLGRPTWQINEGGLRQTANEELKPSVHQTWRSWILPITTTVWAWECILPQSNFQMSPRAKPTLWGLRQRLWGRGPTPCVCAQLFQSCLTLCDPMDCSLPGSSVLAILQVWILEWDAMLSSRGSSCSRINPISPALACRFFTTEPPRKPHLHLSQV